MKFASVYGAFAIACVIVTYALHHGGGRAFPVKSTGQTDEPAAPTPVNQVSAAVPANVEDTDTDTFSEAENQDAGFATADTQDASENDEPPPS